MGIKVLHLIDSGGLYGAEAMLLDLVEAQLKSGLRPMILSAGKSGTEDKPLEAEARKRGLPVMPFRMRAGLNFHKSLEIIRFARIEDYEILHSHGYKFNILLGSLPRRIRNIPLLTTVHGYVHARPLSRMWIYQIADRICLGRMDAVVFVSEATIRNSNLSLDHAIVISNGLRMAMDADTQNNESRYIDDRVTAASFVIGAFGRLTSEKGFEHLIMAFEKFRHKSPGALLVIWGEGYLRNALEASINHRGLADHVLMPGYTNNVPHYMNAINLLALPSLTEGLPIVLLEAMKHKVPVVASSVGAIPEVLEQGLCGILVKPGDPASLAAAIGDIYNNQPDTKGMAERAHARVVKRYSSEVMSGEYLAVYKRLLEYGP